MEYSWQMEEQNQENIRNNSERSEQARHQGPGFIDELEAFMAPVGDACYPPPERRGAHQLPESPPDSGSEHPYSPERPLPADYMLVPGPELMPPEYMYQELKADGLAGGLDVVLPQEGLVDLGLRRDASIDAYGRYVRLDLDPDQGTLTQLAAPELPAYASLHEPPGKRRRAEPDVKSEPAVLSPATLPRPPPSVEGSESEEAPLQSIRFATFQPAAWHALYDVNLKPLPAPTYIVGADKGFNYSQIDESFVCQKKNHFQVTCQLQIQGDPQYVKTADGFKKITGLFIHFFGVKAEDPSQEVRIEQSQSDRTKKPFHPVPVEVRREGTKLTVGRLHFAETTNNNMRKKGRPNPEQRHFQLVVALRAHAPRAQHTLAAHASDRIIVRASNPGQFESDGGEGWWQRGVTDNSLHFTGRVGINTDRPDESCVVNGNLKVMGHIVHPSDARAKHSVEELDTAQQLRNVQSIRVVKFKYEREFAEHSGLLGWDPGNPAPSTDTGVIAQELKAVLPDAVKEAGDIALPNGDTIKKFLVVNKDRIFMENLGAVKELCKVTGNLESRIVQLERINRRLSGVRRRDSARSSGSEDSRYSCLSNSSKSLYGENNTSIEQIRDIARNIRRHECCQKLSHHSPKYTRKQCRSCHQSNFTKYGKYYNYNKTSTLRSAKEKLTETVVDSVDSQKTSVLPDDSFGEVKKKDTCMWVRNSDSFVCGNTRLGFCCRKDYGDNELISNKMLQIIITILIFVMAVCLIVMSALYFKEHQELLSMKEYRYREHYTQYSGLGKFGNLNTPPPPPHRAAAPPDNSHQNQIYNTKHSPHVSVKKTPKEKAHKTTPEYAPAPPEPRSPPPRAGDIVKHVLNIESPSAPPSPERRVSVARAAAAVGGACALDNALLADADVDCQSACNLDLPQTYEPQDQNQEPLENSPEKEQNDTLVYKPTDAIKIVNIPSTPEKNTTETKENDSLKFQMHDELNVAESNLLDTSKNLINGTENETRRLKRETTSKGRQNDRRAIGEKQNGRYKDGVRSRRETNEAFVKFSSETDEMTLSEQSDEIGSLQDCDTVTFGLTSKSFSNETLFEEKTCANTFYNITYSVPVSKCWKEKHIDMTFKSKKMKSLRLCDFQPSRDMSKLVLSDIGWSSKMTLECNVDRVLRVRASFGNIKDLCFLSTEQKIPFIEYNIRLYRDCRS